MKTSGQLLEKQDAEPDSQLPPAGAGGNGASGRLSVGVVVDLFHSDHAGGHVKCWERLVGAASGEDVDLTVYFLGRRRETIPVAANARYELVPPVLGSNRLGFLDRVVDHTDLAPFHPRLLRALRRHHVLHTTEAHFSMARTARYLARRRSIPLVHSMHTDTPGCAEIHAGYVLRRLLGSGAVGRAVVERWNWPARMAGRLRRSFRGHLERCDWLLASVPEETLGINGNLRGRISILRRGIDRAIFHPGRRDRARLAARLGAPPDRPILLFAGRLDPVKNVLTAAHAARRLRQQGIELEFVFAGHGDQAEEIRAILGANAHLVGQVPQPELAWLYASADLFVFPSETEIWPNALLEALACGLPAMVAAAGGSAALVSGFGAAGRPVGMVVNGREPEAWAAALETWLRTPPLRQAAAQAARDSIAALCPTWSEVLRDDLLPVWRRVAAERRNGHGH